MQLFPNKKQIGYDLTWPGSYLLQTRHTQYRVPEITISSRDKQGLCCKKFQNMTTSFQTCNITLHPPSGQLCRAVRSQQQLLMSEMQASAHHVSPWLQDQSKPAAPSVCRQILPPSRACATAAEMAEHTRPDQRATHVQVLQAAPAASRSQSHAATSSCTTAASATGTSSTS